MRYKRLSEPWGASSLLADALRFGDHALMLRPLVLRQEMHGADDEALGA
jgi:hypothetical protein